MAIHVGRRELITGLGGAVVTRSRSARARQRDGVPRLGVLMSSRTGATATIQEGSSYG
jgi:hypothetical protein